MWSQSIEAVPPSCCKTPTTIHCGLRIHPSSISFTVNKHTRLLMVPACLLGPQEISFFQGCVHPISQLIQHRLYIFASVALGFSFLLVRIQKLHYIVSVCRLVLYAFWNFADSWNSFFTGLPMQTLPTGLEWK